MTEGTPSLVQALDAYLVAWRVAGRSAESCRTRRYQLAPLYRLGGPLSTLDEAACNGLILAAFDRGLAHNSVRTFAVALSAFCSWCVKRGWLTESPMLHIEKPKEHIKPQRTYGPVQLRAMLAAARDDYDRAILTLTAGSGLRASEVTGLRWERVDVAEAAVWVKGKGEGGGKWRAVEAAEAIPYLARLPRIGPEVFPFGYQGFALRIKHMAQAAGINHIRPHELRHTFAHEFLEASEEDGMTLQLVLGHTSADMTNRYLQGVREKAALRKMRRVGLASRLFWTQPPNYDQSRRKDGAIAESQVR